MLGKDSDSLNDVGVMQIVRNLQLIAQDYLRKKSVKKANIELGLDHGLPESES